MGRSQAKIAKVIWPPEKNPVGGQSVQKVASYLHGRVEIVHAVQNRVSQTTLHSPFLLDPPPLCLSSERAEEWRN